MSSSPARVEVRVTLLVACTLTLPPGAQWQRYPSTNLPRTTDGKVDQGLDRRAAVWRVE